MRVQRRAGGAGTDSRLCLDRQKPNSIAVQVDGDQGAGLEMGARSDNGAHDDLANTRGENVLSPNLDDTRPSRLSARQQGAEIQIVSENDQLCAVA